METDDFPIPGFSRFSPGLERAGLETLPISFKFLVKIDDFPRRIDSDRPGIENHRFSIEILLKTINLERRARSGEVGDRYPIKIL